MTRLAVFFVAALFLGGCVRYSKATIRPESAITSTAEQRELVKSLKKDSRDPLMGIGRLLDVANATRIKLGENPESVTLQADYNFAISRIVGIIEENDFTPWDAPLDCPSPDGSGTWKLGLKVPDPRPEYHPSNFEILPADRFKFKGELVKERVTKQGLGAPVVVVGKDLDFTKFDKFAQGKKIFYGLTAIVRFDGRNCEIVYYDPLNEETLSFDKHVYGVAGDWQAPLSLALASLNVEKSELEGLFKPDSEEFEARLARLQPYNPNKIPILCVHGLGDSPATWVPLIDFLRNDPEIRGNYQFWFYSYPSGVPYPVAAANLRGQLDQIAERYPKKKELVVIGHSMGGMISRLLMTDSGMAFWDSIFDESPEEISFSENTRTLLKETLIFESRDDIGRVIFASASHRGSDMATSFSGRLGANLVGDPLGETEITAEALAHARPQPNRKQLNRIPNSIDILDPESNFLQIVNKLPTDPGIPYHSLIGDRGKGGNLDKTKPQSSDGIVPYWSSHMDGAETEVIVPSDHWSHLHPLGMAEIKRVLLYHLKN